MPCRAAYYSLHSLTRYVNRQELLGAETHPAMDKMYDRRSSDRALAYRVRDALNGRSAQDPLSRPLIHNRLFGAVSRLTGRQL